MKNYKEQGHRLNVTLGADITSGDPLLVGSILGVATVSGVTGDEIALALTGVYTLPKLSTDVVSVGEPLYWDNTNKYLTTTSTSNTLAGYAFSAQISGDTTVDIRLIFG